MYCKRLSCSLVPRYSRYDPADSTCRCKIQKRYTRWVPKFCLLFYTSPFLNQQGWPDRYSVSVTLIRTGKGRRYVSLDSYDEQLICTFPSLVAISGPIKVSIFRARPPLPVAFVIDVARIKIIRSRAMQTTGTLIVIVDLRNTAGLD